MSKYIVDNTRNKGGNGRLLALPLFIITAFCFGLALWSTQPGESTPTASRAPSRPTSSAPSKLSTSSQENKSHLTTVEDTKAAPASKPVPAASSHAPSPPDVQAPSPTSTSSWTKQWERWKQQLSSSQENKRDD